MDTTLSHSLLTTFTGTTLPYLAANDKIVNLVLLLCLFTTSIILSTSKGVLIALKDNFKANKPHISIFNSITNAEVYSLLLLIIQTALILSVLVYVYITKQNLEIPYKLSPTRTIAIISGAFIAYLLIKWILYSFIGWVFEEKKRTVIWNEAYITIIYYIGLILYPITLIIVYFNPPINLIVYILFCFLFIKKTLILYKGIKLFSKKTWAHMLLILYFCALEIIPCLLLYKFVSNSINVLTFNI